MCRCPYISRFLYVLTFVAAMSAAWAARCSADVIWTDAERDSYVSWLHAAAAADSIAAADSTARIVDSLYPSGYAGDYRLELPLIDLGSATRAWKPPSRAAASPTWITRSARSAISVAPSPWPATTDC